jgi:KUP system potassium uptake protein
MMIMLRRNKSTAALTLGALGIVFGDIGTSPLYALQAIFGSQVHLLSINQANIYGIISLLIWTVTLVVSVKFIACIMRADNQGEGGILALVSLVSSSPLRKKYKLIFILLGLIGASLFYGDSVITPAISVLSAVEGLRVIQPHLSPLILPTTVIILTLLFGIQKYGTGIIGRLFGPVMLIWFVVIGLGGGWQILQHPDILRTLSPLTAVSFVASMPIAAFIAMSAIVLAITGAEALYADMGHFGRPPIARAWFLVVFPALVLCYIGQGSLILHSHGLSGDIFIQMFPSVLRIPVIVIAMLATLIASQSVISGAFSLTKQAVQLKFLPKMRIHHTSDSEGGQIYIPFINTVLFISVVTLVVVFGSSVKLANAYGIAVSGTLAADTILFLVVARSFWHRSWIAIICIAAAFIPIDLLFISSNASKILHGGLLPIAIGGIVYSLISTWIKGEAIIDKERQGMEGSLHDFIGTVNTASSSIQRLPGAAVYIGHHPDFAPLALRNAVEAMHELPQKVVILSVTISSLAHVSESNRVSFDDLGSNDGISHLTLTYGFHDVINIPQELHALRRLSPELDISIDTVPYFISLSKVIATKRKNLARWRKSLYIFMSRNALSTSDYYKLPIQRTEEIQSLIKL